MCISVFSCLTREYDEFCSEIKFNFNYVSRGHHTVALNISKFNFQLKNNGLRSETTINNSQLVKDIIITLIIYELSSEIKINCYCVSEDIIQIARYFKIFINFRLKK